MNLRKGNLDMASKLRTSTLDSSVNTVDEIFRSQNGKICLSKRFYLYQTSCYCNILLTLFFDISENIQHSCIFLTEMLCFYGCIDNRTLMCQVCWLLNMSKSIWIPSAKDLRLDGWWIVRVSTQIQANIIQQ